MDTVRDLADLPNQEGFRFSGLTHGDLWIDCIVRRNENGAYGAYYDRPKGAWCWPELKGWMS